jgi:LemA protein
VDSAVAVSAADSVALAAAHPVAVAPAAIGDEGSRSVRGSGRDIERRTGAAIEEFETGGSRMKKSFIVVGVIVVLLLIIGGRIVGSYNGLVNMQTQVRTAWAEVDNLLQRRNDLIPNLVETVKGFAAQEQAVFGAIAEARARMAGAKTPQERIEAGQAMDSALGRLLVVVENYPQLRSSENFMRLQDELAGTENRLSVGRTRYNETTGQFNAMVRRFPTNIYANMLGFKAEPFYPVSTEAKQAPKVDFSKARPDSVQR